MWPLDGFQYTQRKPLEDSGASSGKSFYLKNFSFHSQWRLEIGAISVCCTCHCVNWSNVVLLDRTRTCEILKRGQREYTSIYTIKIQEIYMSYQCFELIMSNVFLMFRFPSWTVARNKFKLSNSLVIGLQKATFSIKQKYNIGCKSCTQLLQNKKNEWG